MERKVPKSEKYSHVRGVLDTGLTVNKVKPVTAREFAKRRDEIFFRVSKVQIYELYSEYEADEYETIGDTHMSGDVRVVTYSESDQPTYDKPYLILDVREIDQYNECHLLQARSLPYTMLRRDQYHPDIYRYRNRAESLIIVYCDDERISRDAAKLLVDRGIDNIFLLTGGIAEFAYDYPAYVEGNPPSPPRQREMVPPKGRTSCKELISLCTLNLFL
jgi:centrosomal protein CEP41